MKKRCVLWLAAAALAASLTIGLGAASAAPRQAHATNVTLQLKWVPQAQFAGYYAAVKQGLLRQGRASNVTLKNGGPDIIPEQVVASGQAQFGVDWLPSLLAARDKGTDLVNVAQVFARSGMTQLTWKNSGITTIADMKGKKVANWLGGNQYELFAALVKNGMNPDKNQGVTIVQQPFDMNLFLQQPGRLRLGDDLQRARPGARVEEPEDRQALHAGRPERDQDAERRHRHARGRAVLDRQVAERPGQPGDRGQVHRRPRSRAGSTAATTRPTA